MKSSLSEKVLHCSILLLIVLCVFSQSAQMAHGANPDPNRTRAFASPRFVHNELRKERLLMGAKVRTLLAQRKYGELDKLAASLRASPASFGNGMTREDLFYESFYKPMDGDDDKISEPEFRTRIAELTAWTKANPKSGPAFTALGNTVWKYAWLARGGGYAETVSKQGWTQFEERNAKALSYIKVSHNLSDCPRNWYVRLHLANDMSDSRAEYDVIYKQAIEKYPNYMMIYFSRATYLQPRWHGADGEWENFALQVASSIKDPKEANIAYARIVAWVEQTHWYRDSNLLRTFPKISWKNVRAGFSELLKQYPQSLNVRSQFCMLACLAGEKELAKYLFAQVGGQMDKATWHREDTFARWRNWAFQ